MRVQRRPSLVSLVALLAAFGALATGCGGDGLARFEDAGISFRYPKSWPEPAGFTTETLPPRAAVASFSLAGWDPEGACAAYGAAERLPPEGVLVLLVVYTVPLVPEDFPPRPARLTFEGVKPLEFECFGRSYPFFFSVGGRSFQAFVQLGDRAAPKLREQALAVLESIRLEG